MLGIFLKRNSPLRLVPPFGGGGGSIVHPHHPKYHPIRHDIKPGMMIPAQRDSPFFIICNQYQPDAQYINEPQN